MDPLFLSPALPSDLLQFIINHCTYTTTLIICTDRAEFLSSLTQDLLHQQQRPQRLPADEPLDAPTTQQATTDPSHSNPPPPPPPSDHPQPNSKPSEQRQQQQQQQHQQPQRHHQRQSKPHPLLTPHLAQLAATRGVRTVFVPTVTHLRAFLSVFSAHPPPSSHPSLPTTGKRNKTPHPLAPPPPPPPPGEGGGGGGGGGPGGGPPRLVVYGFLALHRGSSEWSVQGLGASSAVLVEAGKRAGVGVVVVEGLSSGPCPVGLAEAEEGLGLGTMTMGEVLAEGVPVLSGGGRRTGGEWEGGGWAGKRVDVGRALARWFRFREGEWAMRGRVEDRNVLGG